MMNSFDVFQPVHQKIEVFDVIYENSKHTLKFTIFRIDINGAHLYANIFSNDMRYVAHNILPVEPHQMNSGLECACLFRIAPSGFNKTIGVTFSHLDSIWTSFAVYFYTFANGDETKNIVAKNRIAARANL